MVATSTSISMRDFKEVLKRGFRCLFFYVFFMAPVWIYGFCMVLSHRFYVFVDDEPPAEVKGGSNFSGMVGVIDCCTGGLRQSTLLLALNNKNILKQKEENLGINLRIILY